MDTTSARRRFSGPGSRELDAAGITDAALRDSYARCRTLNAAHGKTYYLAALLLPGGQAPVRPCPVRLRPPRRRHRRRRARPHRRASARRELVTWSEDFLADLEWGATSDPVSRAPPWTPSRAGRSRTATSPTSSTRCRWTSPSPGYETFDDLRGYMWGSAAVIGLQMLPILGRARRRRALGRARVARHRPRHRLPADELHPRRRRGPAPRPHLPAAGDARRSSASTRSGCAAASSTNRSATCSPGRSSGRAASTPRPLPASTSSTRPRGTACAAR